MEKVLVTGGNGFVGNYLLKYILEKNTNVQVHSISHSEPKRLMSGVAYKTIDLLESHKLEEYICNLKPDYVFHLAAMSSVGQSWKEPAQSFLNNLNIYINLLESVRKSNLDCRILSVGSSEVYGIIKPEFIPLNEENILNPISPYAVARVSQEMISKVYIKGFDMNIVLTRSFNHIGPGQDIRFAIPSFINQAIQRKKSNSSEPILVGDLSIIRDFTDVRDVVRAYYELIRNGKIGEIYNICSSQGTSLFEITEKIKTIVDINNPFIPSESFIRPIDNPIIVGDYTKICKAIGWKPEISLDQSLVEMYESQHSVRNVRIK